jgi:hypothetical protein
MRMRPHLLGDDVHAHVGARDALGGARTCWEARVRVGGRVYVLGGTRTRWGVRVRVRGRAYALGGAR